MGVSIHKHGPSSGAESFWMRTGPGWARIWRARTKKALWEEAAEAGETAGARQPPRWPETARIRRRPSMLDGAAGEVEPGETGRLMTG